MHPGSLQAATSAQLHARGAKTTSHPHTTRSDKTRATFHRTRLGLCASPIFTKLAKSTIPASTITAPANQSPTRRTVATAPPGIPDRARLGGLKLYAQHVRGTLVLLIGVALVVASLIAFRLLTDPTAGVALLSFGIVLTGLGWHLRSRENPRP